MSWLHHHRLHGAADKADLISGTALGDDKPGQAGQERYDGKPAHGAACVKERGEEAQEAERSRLLCLSRVVWHTPYDEQPPNKSLPLLTYRQRAAG
jgi:hypothetical protein